MSNHYAVILAGGRGERFWPLSTAKRPKQLLSLVGDKPLLSQAVDRLDGLVPRENIFVVTNAELVEPTCSACPELLPENVIGEPVGRDTGPAVALSAALVKARSENGVFCILTADHVIGDVPLFQTTLREGLALAEREDVILTIGIKPNFAATGYGYVEAGEAHADKGGISIHKTLRFVEKPDQETAEAYLKRGTFYWNSGMFIWSVKTLEQEFAKHCPELLRLIEALTPTVGSPDFLPELTRQFEGLQKISIDYALMEKADSILMAEGIFSWDDVGSWPAIENHFDKDPDGNVLVGSCEQVDASNNIVVSQDHVTALIGVDNLVVVQAEGVTLICPKDQAQNVKQLVEKLRANSDYEKYL